MNAKHKYETSMFAIGIITGNSLYPHKSAHVTQLATSRTVSSLICENLLIYQARMRMNLLIVLSSV